MDVVTRSIWEAVIAFTELGIQEGGQRLAVEIEPELETP